MDHSSWLYYLFQSATELNQDPRTIGYRKRPVVTEVVCRKGIPINRDHITVRKLI